MKITIKSRYLVFPVNVLASKKKVSFINNDEILYELNLNLDNISPDFEAYVDVSRFMGEELSVSVSPEIALDFKEADEIEKVDLYCEPLRPTVHFTTKSGWINDPNGLIYLNGEYHLFYQYNPCLPEWDNMHWGHAVSSDLLHWKELPIALYPDSTGMMFSGSAFLDSENVSGLGSKESPAVLLFYTATDPFSQHIAYSADNFKTIKKYENNPAIPHIVGSNRDPKVVYAPELSAYVMALYLEKDIYGFFTSSDLLSWNLVGKTALSLDNECPDLFALYDEKGNKKWVLMGAHGRYAVGNLTESGFESEQEDRTLHYGRSAYAGQTFSGIGDGRVVRIDWDRWSAKHDDFCGQMSIPYDLSLSAKDDSYYLCAKPISEIEKLYGKTEKLDNIKISKNISFKYDLLNSAYHIKLRNEDALSNDVKLTVFGREFIIKPKENRVNFGKESFPLGLFGSVMDIELVVDKCSIEIFADDGKIYSSYLSNATISDYNVPFLELKSDVDTKIEHLEINSLKSIWQENQA